RAFGLPVAAHAALVLQGLIGFGVALPSSPGFFGPFEAATRVTLQLYGVAPAQAVSYAVRSPRGSGRARPRRGGGRTVAAPQSIRLRGQRQVQPFLRLPARGGGA